MLKPFPRHLACLVPFLVAQILPSVSAQDDDVLVFRSRPDLTPPTLFVTISEYGIVPGYIFMAPYQTDQVSPLIYDTQGQLIWSGYATTGGGTSHAFHVCNYNETDHLCFFRGEQQLGYARGFIDILDQNYTSTATINTPNGISSIDMHENTITADGSSMLILSYHPERYDLSNFNITTGEGWIQNGIAQKIDVSTGDLLWEWSAIDHVGLDESYILPNTSEVAGTGFSASSPWDYIHLNSVDENEDGDFLLSARHTNTVYKVSGEDGSIMWRLGGTQSDFEFEDDFTFSSQHDARWKSSNESTDIITLFDNASNGFTTTADISTGMIIRLDHSSDPPRATLLTSFPAPNDIPISASQGNMQLLGDPADWETSNAVIGWGSQPYVTEHLPSGEIIWQANIAANGPMNYRAYKFNFTGTPRDTPALYTYARSTEGREDPTIFYMSWNGATEVARWRIYGRGTCGGNWTELDTIDKDGFETSFAAPGFWQFGMVEALDADGTSLRNSTARGVRTFVPSPALAESCDGTGCNVVTEYVQGVGQAVIETPQGCPAAPNNASSESADENLANEHAPVNVMVMMAAVAGAIAYGFLV